MFVIVVARQAIPQVGVGEGGAVMIVVVEGGSTYLVT